jgi:hypothetical protein
MSTRETTPQVEIVTTDTLNTFKDELLAAIGISISNKSLIQSNNTNVLKTATSAVFGSNHSVDVTEKAGLKNVLIAGMGNVASTWNQTVLGQFNEKDDNALFIIGNGSSTDARKNAIKVLKDGKININGCTVFSSNSKIVSQNKISYTENIADFDSIAAITTYLNANYADTDLIPAKLLKSLLANIKDSDGTTTSTFIDSLDTAIANLKNELKVELENSIQPQISNSTVIALDNKISNLQKEMSYLLSW